MNKTVTDWIRPEIQQLTAYHVPELTDAIKLDAMENPYHWDARLIEEWLNVLRTTPLNRYPDPAARVLKKQLRAVMQVPNTMDMILGNGSDEIIQMLALTLNGEGRILLAPEPSFVMYRLIAQFVGMQYIGIPLEKNDFKLDMLAMLETIKTYQPALIFLAYPNNPSGNAFATQDIEAIIETASGLVVIDEAYAPFADNTFMSRLGEYPNLLVMRTVSKLGLAGLRLGLLAGPQAWLKQIEKTRLPYNINVLTQMSAIFALQHYAVLEKQTLQIKADRAKLLERLNAIDGIQTWASQANFILFRVADAQTVFDNLKNKGVLIKCLHGSHPLLENCLRVTVGTPEENQAFLQELTHIISLCRQTNSE
ncbi:histidinol-phosphate aminotransferase [Candidatus Thiomargarita nelsonii]|uniref:Histidinol-phosphate aminotransferase n=1 Tax=Candidatus Thiomargarita nelsonii TaxID=1003181 RepID=A0A0A6PD10_9GAMM|nr:histidinol-phosphate aminotransferase [Candidatus Thiomargarita nelsonii]